MVEFKIGDKVYSIGWGWGVVTNIGDGIYPVLVKFSNDSFKVEGNTISFTKDGKQYQSALRTLFFEEIPIPESALVRKHQYKKGDLVWWTDLSGVKRLRIVASVGNDKIGLFSDGRDSGDTFFSPINQLKPYDNQ